MAILADLERKICPALLSRLVKIKLTLKNMTGDRKKIIYRPDILFLLNSHIV